MGLCSSTANNSIAPVDGDLSTTTVAPTKRATTTEAKMEARAKFARKKNVRVRGDEGTVDFEAIPDVPKEEAETTFLKEALKKQWLFANLDDEALSSIVLKMSKRNFAEDEEIIAQGQEGLEFFVIESGLCGVKVDGKTLPHTIAAGQSFGELALFYEEPRSATVFAKEATLTWVLGKDSFRGGLAHRTEEICDENAKFLMDVPFFKEFQGDPALKSYVQKVAEVMVPAEFKDGQTIIKQGDEGNTFYIVTHGECQVEEDGNVKDHTLTAGTWFGEKALVGESSVRTATITAKGPVKCVAMDRESFTELMGPFEVFRDTHSYEQKDLGMSNEEVKHLNLDDYETRRVLGVGGFGLVTLVARKSDGALFANKKMQKSLVVQEQMQKFVRQEKLFLAELSGHPYVPILEGSTRDDDSVYLLLEFLSGGDLFSVIEQHGCLNEKPMVQFVAACTILGLKHVHKHSIAFRDLKLENLVLDGRGYIKLVDFGLAKRILSRSYTFCGSPRYCAPEMVTGKGHHKGVDWWALGVVLYESLYAMSPFDDNCDDVELFRRIASAPLEFPSYPSVSRKAKSFISALLKKDQLHRLGALASGSKGCMDHPWFEKINWDDMKNQSSPAPYVPKSYNQEEDKSASDSVDVPPMHSILTKYRPDIDPMKGWDDAF